MELSPGVIEVEIFIDKSQESHEGVWVLWPALFEESGESSEIEPLVSRNGLGQEQAGSEVTKDHWVDESDGHESWVKR